MIRENCFIASIGARGYINMLKPKDFNNENLFALNYMPQKNILYLSSKYSSLFLEKNFDVQIILNPIDVSVVGFIVPKLNVGFVSFMPFEVNFFKDKTVFKDRDVVFANQYLNKGYEYLNEAFEIHDQWEQMYINSINFNILNRLRDNMISKIFNDETSYSGKGIRTDRFFGATSSNGPVDFLGETIKNYKTRYFIKGRPGSGKSTFLKAIAQESLKNGFDTCIYHCSFDSESLDMVTVNDMDLCIFDSTAPHEYFPTRKDDNVIDIYKLAISNEFDIKYKTPLDKIKAEYSSKISEAVKYIKKANEHLKVFRVKYSATYDDRKFRQIEVKFSSLLKQL